MGGSQGRLWLRGERHSSHHFESFALLLRGRFLIQRNLLLLQQELVEGGFLGFIVAVDLTELYFDAGNVVD